ncbi:MAG: M48 family metallopeptidase [Chlorobiaceae bacterium]|nr:M48 family metallopeptidase [Chlorobiaceae bacterium]
MPRTVRIVSSYPEVFSTSPCEKCHIQKPQKNCWANGIQKRWGSLSENGMVTLNPELVKAPRECIDWGRVKHRLELSMC